MTPNDIILAVRMAPEIKDMDAAHYSDYDILQALNDVAAYLYNTLAEQTSSLLDKRAELLKVEGNEDGFALPEDFLQIVSAYNGDARIMEPQTKDGELTEHSYRIIGAKLYTKSKAVTLVYKPFFVDLTANDLEKDMDLPPFFKTLIKKAVILILQGSGQQDTAVLQLVADGVAKIVGNMAFSQISGVRTWAEVV